MNLTVDIEETEETICHPKQRMSTFISWEAGTLTLKLS